MPPTNYAIVIKGPGLAAVEEVPIPVLREDYISVKIKAVAVNPTDWKHIDNYSSPGAYVGCDFAGLVDECHGSNAVYHEDGTFAEYATAKGDVQMEIPENMSFEEAATLGAGVSTVGLALYRDLGLPLPKLNQTTTNSMPVLVYGGSTATGCLMIQFAKLSGLKVYTTCRAHNFPYVRSIGADAAFDYTEPDVVEQIKKHSGENIHHVVDCIAEGDSPSTCIRAMSANGGIYDALRQYVTEDEVKALNDKVQMKQTLGYTIFGENFTLGSLHFEAKPEDFEFGKVFWELATELFAEGRVKAHKFSVNEHGGGLKGVMKGIESLRKKEVSGKKLVYTL